jgi:HTH-type transcriptional regulator, transcriptional repressor of NAD biosynthesis genes
MVGLVIGKFHPLHKGHLGLFQNSLQYCEKLLVVVFNKSEYKIEANDDRVEVIYDSFEGLQQIEFRSSKGISRIFAEYLKQNYRFDILFGNEQYVKYMADWIGCKYKIVGSDFKWHANDIKHDIWNKFEHIAEVSKRDFSLNLCLIGTGSTYKTTLSNSLKKYYKSSILIPEIGKEFVKTTLSGDLNKLVAEHFDTIIKSHFKQINNSIGKSPLVIRDTDYLTSKFWCLKYFNVFKDELDKYYLEPDIYILCGQEGAKYTKDFCNTYDQHKAEEEIELFNFYHQHTKKPIFYVDGNYKNRLKLIRKIVVLELDRKISVV